MIKAYVFDKDKINVVNVDKINVNRKILWVDVVAPTKEEIKIISKKFGITRSTINNCLDPEERARVENKEDKTIVIFKVPAKNKKEVETTSFGIIVSKKFILTIKPQAIPSIGKLSKEIDVGMVRKNKYSYLFAQILWKVTRGFIDELDKLEDVVDKLEDRLLRNNTIQVGKVFTTKKTLLYFRKALITNREVLMFLEKGGSPFVTKSSIEGLLRENLQLVDTEELIRARISETSNMHLTNMSNNLNESMKYFAVIAALFLLPMLISGAYGMNFKVIPLATHPYGFWMMVGLMIVSMSIMYYVFKKKAWI